MSDALPMTYLARHGETAWTISRQHTGGTDIPLTRESEAQARRLGVRLDGAKFVVVLTSPLHNRSEPVIRLWDEMPHEPRIDSIQEQEHREKAGR